MCLLSTPFNTLSSSKRLLPDLVGLSFQSSLAKPVLSTCGFQRGGSFFCLPGSLKATVDLKTVAFIGLASLCNCSFQSSFRQPLDSQADKARFLRDLSGFHSFDDQEATSVVLSLCLVLACNKCCTVPNKNKFITYFRVWQTQEREDSK